MTLREQLQDKLLLSCFQNQLFDLIPFDTMIDLFAPSLLELSHFFIFQSLSNHVKVFDFRVASGLGFHFMGSLDSVQSDKGVFSVNHNE